MASNTLNIINNNFSVDILTLKEYKKFSVIDLSLPFNKLQAEQNPGQFISSFSLPVHIKNIDFLPGFLSSLAASDIDLSKVVASCSQNYYLKEIVERENLEKVAFIDLSIRPQKAQEEKVFAPTSEFINNLTPHTSKNDVLTQMLNGWVFKGDTSKIAEYISGILRNEIMGKTTVSDELKYYRFIASTAAAAGTVINYSALANNVGITAPTARVWLKFLEGTGLVYLVYPMENVPGKRMMKAPKVYFRDTGICSYLLQLKDTNELLQSVYYKKLFENFVMNLIRESYIENQEEISWRFYRDSNAKEISAIIRRDNIVYPVMIDLNSISSNKLNKTFDIIKGYCEENGLELGTGVFITSGNDSRKLDSGNDIIQINVKDLVK